MALSKAYNFEKYSALDIQAYLEKNGFKTELTKDLGGTNKYHIRHTDVYFDIPIIDINGSIISHIHFLNNKESKFYDSSKKLFTTLKHKYQVKKMKTNLN